ncbi:uncharacterized protein LOC130676391 [Microplitis mediator]|uniref:uncharacterized protein LOC130676391 n=1 Tax=Microplitis mediator TaxID=375433 RepID=UPI002554B742|nr:uncharacterized protein LOC130676391 [Microplitis mediator]
MGKNSKKRSHSLSIDEIRRKLKRYQAKLDKCQQELPADEGSGMGDASSIEDLDAEDTGIIDPVIDNKENSASNDLEKTETTKDKDFADLDDEILEILGDGKSSTDEGEFLFHPKLAEVWKKVLIEGLEKDNKVNLLKIYPRKGNCPILTPKLNPEVEATVNETVRRRDKYQADEQDLCGASLSSLGKAISMILNDEKQKIDKKELLTALVDSGKLMCEQFKILSKARKAFIYPGLDKKAKSVLEKSETDEYLFGSGLSERVKTAKSVEKVGLSLKPQAPEKKTNAKPHSTLNWKSPFVKAGNQTQTGYQRRVPPKSFYQSRTCLPHQTRPVQNCSLNANDEPYLQAAVNKLLELGAIRVCVPCNGQFLSTYFLVPKPNGDYRFVLNLKDLNKYILTFHFKMEDLRTAIKLMSKGCFMGTIDLKDAYFLIPIANKYRKYLRFMWKQLLFEWTCVPFGLNIGPWLFTKISKPIANFLRSLGFLSVVYLDDWLCFGRDIEECLNNLNQTKQCLESVGFVVNKDKSTLLPDTRCQFLGQLIYTLITKFKNLKTCSIREFAQFVGNITAACPAVQYGWAYSKSLERQKYLALLKSSGNYDAKMKLSACLTTDLNWWQNNILISVNPIRQQHYKLEIFTDASLTGWGAACNNELTNGAWYGEELNYSINHLELIAAYFGLQCFAEDKRDCEILLRIDNTTAISYINRMGGIQYPNLNAIARKIWQWCEQRNLWITASYIASKENIEADYGSRIVNPDTEWELADWAFQRIVKKFGTPEIDLFASRTNRKCEKFCSWHRDPDAYCVDAFTMVWADLKFYAFPPFSLILRTLKKIEADQAQGDTSTPTVSKNAANGRDIVWQTFLKQDFNEKAVELLVGSITDSTMKQYNKPLQEWKKFSSERKIDMFKPQTNQVINWLTQKYQEGASYGSLNTARSALSLIAGDKIGKDPTISRLMKGVFNQRPSKPKYEKIFSLDPVLDNLEKLYPLENLSMLELTEKLVMLLAIVTAHRKQTLALIKVNNIMKTDSGYEIKIPDRIKTTKPGGYQPLLIIPKFEENPKLCAASVLERYLRVTKEKRDKTENLLLTTRSPFGAASKDTISRWIRAFLNKSGIGAEFGPHSVRHASTSAALKKGVDINVIKSLAGWSERSRTFDRFYNRPIINDKKTFTDSILNRK